MVVRDSLKWMFIPHFLFQQSVPMRHKEVHFINVPSALKYVYDFTRSRLSQKIRDRFTVRKHSKHSSVESLYPLIIFIFFLLGKYLFYFQIISLNIKHNSILNTVQLNLIMFNYLHSTSGNRWFNLSCKLIINK